MRELVIDSSYDQKMMHSLLTSTSCLLLPSSDSRRQLVSSAHLVYSCYLSRSPLCLKRIPIRISFRDSVVSYGSQRLSCC